MHLLNGEYIFPPCVSLTNIYIYIFNTFIKMLGLILIQILIPVFHWQMILLYAAKDVSRNPVLLWGNGCTCIISAEIRSEIPQGILSQSHMACKVPSDLLVFCLLWLVPQLPYMSSQWSPCGTPWVTHWWSGTNITKGFPQEIPTGKN